MKARFTAAPPERSHYRQGLRCSLLRHNESEPRGDLCREPNENGCTLAYNALFSDKVGRFGHGMGQCGANGKVAALGRVVVLSLPSPESKHLHTS